MANDLHAKKRRDAESNIEWLLESGWAWSSEDRLKRHLVHPDDPEINVWYHPDTFDAHYSPRLAEQIRLVVNLRGD